jgi:SpoVK/Ycf46/Vps4 family AAA+-type ATPase
MYMGRSEQNLHAIFATARRKAPCVLFFDELDALGQKRALTRHHPAARSLAAQFLTELDGVGTENQGVFILGATNHPWDVDSALRRPGRFDRVLLVLPPDQPAREAILAYHLRDRPVAPGVAVGAVARRTDGFSGADLAHLVESAAERALMDSMELGEVRPIDEGDVAHALAEVRPSIRGWFQQARQHALFANEGGMYDDLLDYIRANRLG